MPEHSRGFETPLPRTESPGLAQLIKLCVDTKYGKMSSAGQIAAPTDVETQAPFLTERRIRGCIHQELRHVIGLKKRAAARRCKGYEKCTR